MNLLRAMTTIGGLTLASRVLGFVRDVLIAAILGAGPVADALVVAFRLPNLFRRLFAEGAFNMAFVPLFAGQVEEHGLAAARDFADRAFAVLLWTLLAVLALAQVAMPGVILGIAGGFADDPATFDLAVGLTRITFPYLVFISLVSLMGGMLNSLGRFAAAAATPVILNLFLITAALAFTGMTETPAHALAWGMAVGGLAQFLWLLVHCARAGAVPRLVRPRLDGPVRLMLKRMGPAAVGAGIYQVNLVVDTLITSFLPAGSLAFLFFADRVNQLPLGVVGVAAGTALLPMIARLIRAGDHAGALHAQNRAIEFTLLLTLPAAAAFVVIAHPIIDVLFRRGAFDDTAVAATAAALAVYALGLPAYVGVKVLSPGFFARGDTLTPVKAAAVGLVANLVLNLALMGPFRHVGIAMATVASSWLNVGILWVILLRRGHLMPDDRLRRRLPRMVLASALMGAGLWALTGTLGPWLAGGPAQRTLALAGLIAAGLAGYGVLAQATGAASVRDLKGFLRRGA